MSAPSPHFVRITFGGESLGDFVSASFDDHVKLIVPAGPDHPLVLPTLGATGPTLPDGVAPPAMRDYTPRFYDAARGTLDIEIALHGEGPAASFGARAKVGDEAGIGGPKGSLIIPTDFDFHLFVGDETALPAISRRLEELPRGARVVTIVEVGDRADARAFRSEATVDARYLTRGEGPSLAEAVGALTLPTGDGFAWAAGEASSMQAVRNVLVQHHGMAKERLRVAAYWKHGARGHHKNLDE